MPQALLIFARRPQAGRVKTRLAPVLTHEEAAELYDCMVRDVLAQSRELAGVSRFLFYEDTEGAIAFFRGIDAGLQVLPQEGLGLGIRLEKAFEEVFARGYSSVAVIGTDSPDLPLSFISQAFVALEEDQADVVFGPAEDGGYYLVALRKPCPELFRHISWSSSTVLEQSVSQANENGLRIALLPCWYDVDEPADLFRPRLIEKETRAPLTASFLRRALPKMTSCTSPQSPHKSLCSRSS